MSQLSTLTRRAPVRRLTLALPTGLIADIGRLAAMRERSFEQELAEDFAFLLRLALPLSPATMLEHLFEVEQLGEPRESVGVALPQASYEALGALARAYSTTRSRALAALMCRGARSLLATQALGQAQGLPFAEAFLARLQTA